MKIPRPGVRSAFTLIELLVVLAIIGILAALLLAALTGGTGMARRIYCANNVRQLGQAMQLFVGDKHSYPLVYNPDLNENKFWEKSLIFELDNSTRFEGDFFKR